MNTSERILIKAALRPNSGERILTHIRTGTRANDDSFSRPFKTN